MVGINYFISATCGLALAFGFSTVNAFATTADPAMYFSENFFPLPPPPPSNFFGSPGTTLPGSSSGPLPFPTNVDVNQNGVSSNITNNFNVPSLSLTANIPSGLDGGTIQSTLTYFIRYMGSTLTVDAPVQAAGSVSLSFPSTPTSLNASANAFLSISNVDGTDVPLPQPKATAFCDFTACGPSGTASFSQSGNLSFVVGDEYKVVMTVSIANILSDALKASAFVDPFFGTPPGYELDISNGIGNSALSPTPLPAALPLFATGLGGLGLLGWRRKRKAQAVAA
jgi:hypothetical protein